MCKAVLKATDVIKKALVEANSHRASGEGIQGGSGQSTARRTTTEPLQALYQAELEDMCQDDDEWQWEGIDDWNEIEGEEWETWTGP